MPPIDFCNCVDSRARPATVQTSPHGCDSKLSRGGWGHPCGQHPTEPSQLRGRLLPGRSPQPPRRRPLFAVEDLPRPDSSSDTSCHAPAPTSAWNNGFGRRPNGRTESVDSVPGPSRCLGRIRGASMGGLACRAHGAETPLALKGRPPSNLAKDRTADRTRGAFHLRDPRLLSRAASRSLASAWVSPLPKETSRHLCYRTHRRLLT